MGNKSNSSGFTSTGKSGATKVKHHNSNRGFSPFPLRGLTTESSNGTLLAGLNAGVTVLSGSAAITSIMPLAAEALGGLYAVRAGSADAHILTASQETNGTLPFTDGTNNGSRLTLPAIEGSSVSLQCDGVNFIVLGTSGSITIDGT
jgi:hypothetical protein